MARPISKWVNKKFKGKVYDGSYGKAAGSKTKWKYERCFILSRVMKNGKEHFITFESYQAAKAAGWRKIV